MKQGMGMIVIMMGMCSFVFADSVDFVREIRPIFAKHCVECHGAKKQKSGLRLDVKSEALKGGDSYPPDIIQGNAKDSPLIRFVTGEEKDLIMPPEGDRLSAEEIAILKQWVDSGAPWPDGVDAYSLKDRRDHWAFKPVTPLSPPLTADSHWPRNDVDQFILARLEKNSCGRRHRRIAPLGCDAFPSTLSDFRRLRNESRGLVEDTREDAYEIVVDELLASPRYGERWALHWLDVVRYADTHGFEVNTERPNAWPYRDYVIQAFNNDTPYDQFIREQILGDTLHQDAATGFLVTASVLLPGQIGADEPSKRLARQDSLDEIVVNIGQSFLGLSIGCARCHDHKFDPISQRDYYSLQSLVAGVEYADREIETPEANALRQEADRLKPRRAQIDQQLAQLEPKARSGAERSAVSPRQNNDRFDPVKASRLRFTINATNNLEPCLDELEVFNSVGENIARLAGTMVKSSGDTTVADRHELRFINDGQYGNSRSWMSNEQGRGWVELEFPAEQEIVRVVWGRDREGQFTDRLATDYRIEVATSRDWTIVADSTDRHKVRSQRQHIGRVFLEGIE